MEFAARYVGHFANAATAPGAWVAFRESATLVGGYNQNVTDYEFHLRLLNAAEATAGLDARKRRLREGVAAATEVYAP